MSPLIVREALMRGETWSGIWRTLPSDALTEIIALGGFNFQIFDQEHGALSWSETHSMLRVNNLAGKASFVRLGDRSPIAAQRALDAGAIGLVYPQVNTLNDISCLAENISFAPSGRRGFNPFVATFGYGSRLQPEEFLPLLMPIVETKEGLSNLGEISNHPAVDIVYLGAYDLSVQLGVPGQIQSDVVMRELNSAVETCKRNRCQVGLMATSVEAMKYWSERGVQVFLQGVDGGVLSKSFTAKFI